MCTCTRTLVDSDFIFLCCPVHCSQYNLTVSAKVSKHLVETTLKALADITKKLVGVGVGGVSWPCVGGAGGRVCVY